ncbi:phytoene/squalene synthase family protein [Pontibacter sp. G13]|uniref:phytoene/squalene synthase family protein n=1 Tax=Pontibacter sp. G13 TaxID=3074898 RepID=UPI00288AED29|nr:phytoene/squalene synthase family protein [Pontibacter sp. G13]WNJ21123.1 phytoene/squalene synthase family protein [Pontibacter sp. G13]
MQLFLETCQACSKVITNAYSTSFSLGIKTLNRKYRGPIYNIYGFVRFADEIVDTFHDYDKAALLSQFREDTWKAIEEGISLNPVLHSFQQVVREYQIERELIEAFLDSMEMDLHHDRYDSPMYNQYIYGSAEVVGLMCLRVFCEGDDAQYQALRAPARSLGRAFQKVNFLRDMQADFEDRGRLYFPGVEMSSFDKDSKKAIEEDIRQDFEDAYLGIIRLPEGARAGVLLAYRYYLKLFRKICGLSPTKILEERIRIPNPVKISILVGTYFRHSLSLL